MYLFNIKDLCFLHCGPINFQIKSSEILGLSGDSGSGKSRLLRALADLDEHQGEIQLDGNDQQNIVAHEWRKKVALLPAETSWWFDTVEAHFYDANNENFLNNLGVLGFSKNVLQWSVARLSSGEKQRLGLLRLLENNPHILLLDEPTANLDKNNTQLFENFIKHYLSLNKACAIWVSHDAEQLQRVSTLQYVIENGKLKNVD